MNGDLRGPGGDGGADRPVTELVPSQRRPSSKPVVAGWTWPLRAFVALVILAEFLGILLLVSWLYSTGG